MKAAEDLSLRPYLLRAICEWCAEKRYTPYLTADARRGDVRVPPAVVSDGAVVFNIAPTAVRDLHIGEAVSFHARFGGAAFRVFLPAGAITAIYARETGSGMKFPPIAESAASPPLPPSEDKPHLRIV